MLKVEEKSRSLPFGEGLQILLITSIAYLCAYRYERGYCNYFGIPHNLIVLDVTTFLLFGSAIAGATFALNILSQCILASSRAPKVCDQHSCPIL
jgi:hypothetical protein